MTRSRYIMCDAGASGVTAVTVHRAGAIGDLHVPQLVIKADEEWPDTQASADIGLVVIAERYEAEAVRLEEALFQHLPGGVYDRIFVEMARRKASLYLVSHATPNGK